MPSKFTVVPANRELRERLAAHMLTTLIGYESKFSSNLPRMRRDVRFVLLGTVGSTVVLMWAKLLGW